MKKLEDKKILFIALSGYSNGIKKMMETLGAKVDYFNDKPNDGFICKACGRYQIKVYDRILENYYEKIIESVKENSYDYILILRGEYTPIKSTELLKKTFPSAKLVLYMWDSLINVKGIEKKWKTYDKVYTFDRIDYLNHKNEIEFLPLYYYDQYIPKAKIDSCEYDIAFIGTGHEDRVKIIKQITEQCEKSGRKIYSFVFLPHILVYYYNKVLNKHFKNVTKADLHFEKLPFEKVYETYNNAKCVVDIESSKQHGLTMRTIEMVGLRKKLITTNKDIVNYDFYHENNILVVDRENFVLDQSFCDKPYVELSEEIYRKYSLSNWLSEVFK